MKPKYRYSWIIRPCDVRLEDTPEDFDSIPKVQQRIHEKRMKLFAELDYLSRCDQILAGGQI